MDYFHQFINVFIEKKQKTKNAKTEKHTRVYTFPRAGDLCRNLPKKNTGGKKKKR